MSRLTVDAVSWLRSDVVAVVSVLPGQDAPSELRAATSGARSPGALDQALARWGRQLARQRMLVLAPRALASALSLDVLIALGLAASGSRLELSAIVLLLLLPILVFATAIISSRGDPSLPVVARVLDRDLALDERLGTAIEIAGGEFAADGLAAMVVTEANAALVAGHLSGARPTHRSARHEWLAVACLLLALSGLLIVISGHGDAPVRGPIATATSGARAGEATRIAGVGAKHSLLGRGQPRTIRPGGGRARTQPYGSGGRNSPLSVVTQPQNSRAGGRLPIGSPSTSPTHSGASPRTPGSPTPGNGAKGGRLGAGGRVGTHAGGRPSASTTGRSATSSRGTRAGTSRGASAGRDRPTNPQRVGGGSRAGTFQPRSTSARGSGKASSNSNSQAHTKGSAVTPSAHSSTHTRQSAGRHGSPAGGAAGTGAGGNALGRRQTKRLATGTNGRLPILSGYAPAQRGSSPKTSNLSGRSGGKGPPRSSTGSGDGAATADTLPYVPSSADLGTTADNALLRHFFSAAPTVPGRW